MKFSIVIAAYNAENYIHECICSFLTQTFRDFEIVVVDDGSSDRTKLEIQRFALIDERVIYLGGQHVGQGASRMKGLEIARGEYIIFFDADDIALETMLERLNSLLKDDTDILIFGAGNFRDGTRGIGYRIENLPDTASTGYVDLNAHENNIFQTTFGWAWDKVYKREFVLKNCLSFPNLKHSEDLVFTYGSLTLKPTVFLCKELLVLHRVGNKKSVSMTRQTDPIAHLKAIEMLIKNYPKIERTCFSITFKNWLVHFLFWHIATIGPSYRRQVLNETKQFLQTKKYASDYRYLSCWNKLKLNLMEGDWLIYILLNMYDLTPKNHLASLRKLFRITKL